MANVYQSVLTWIGGDQLFQNVLHFHLTESGTASPQDYAADLNQAIEDNIIPVWIVCIADTVELRSIKSKRVSGTGGFNVIKLYAPGDVAGSGGSPMGNTCECAVLEFPVILSGKNVTGKIFMSGLPDSAVIANGFSSAFLTLAAAFMTNLFDTMTLAGGHGDADFTIYNRVTKADTQPDRGNVGMTVGTQHRRLRP
jgi:hypothetical protein